tara:strand:- start:7788 stop:8258 length:471 start_codon:yes stop_codon:yes gene_type:complete
MKKKTGLKKELDEIKEDIQEVKEELEELDYLQQLQRLQAEFINYRTRVEKEKQDSINYGKEEIILQFLDVLDNFERALEHNKDQGIEMIYNQMQAILKEQNVNKVETNTFNPQVHECVCKECSEEEQDTILEVFQKGYTFNNKTIRPAKVKISGGK